MSLPKPSSSSLNLISKSNVRVELFFKGKKDLSERIHFLSNHGITSFNLVNKSRQDTMIEWVECIKNELPSCSICSHYSLKYNKSSLKKGRDQDSYNMFTSFIQSSPIVMNNNGDELNKMSEVLLISGSGEKAKLDPIAMLQRLQKDDDVKTKATIAVAYNPFFSLENDQITERNRLLQKLQTNQVNKIYLQFGTDLEMLQSTLKWLSSSDIQKYNISISGSIFLPTKKLIAQQKFRPWNGVFLSEEFLSSPDNAYQIVLRMMKLYEEYDCEILFEAPGVRNEKDMALVEKLLSDRDSLLESNNFETNLTNQTSLTTRSNTNLNEKMTNVPLKRRKVASNLHLSPSKLTSPESLENPAILLFGSHDIRIHDNEAFQLASFHSQVIPVFLWDKESQGKWGVNGALEVVLKDALRNLKKKLQNHKLDLICRNTNDMTNELLSLCSESGATVVYLNKEHVPESQVREDSIKRKLELDNIVTVACQSSLLYDPAELSLTGGFNGGHWGTLMPFLKGCKKQLGEPRRPIAKHESFGLLEMMKGPKTWPSGINVEELDLGIVDGKDKWDLPILERFSMSEESAENEMEVFMKKGFLLYEKERSRADIKHSTSKLSPHLRVGTLSPNELYYKIEDSPLSYDEKKTFARRLFWRDLAYYHLLNFPTMRDSSIRAHYEHTKWCEGEEEKKRFEAWKTGKTGFPLVDAGMRELYKTGWLTQSLRMVVASFLTEYLRVNWVKGCEWFHYTLVDADSAINAMMWQNAGRRCVRILFLFLFILNYKNV
jgi:deoxyribodipyrimidine photolyase